MNITEFKKGSIITRVEPIDDGRVGLWFTGGDSKNYSQIGDRFEFKGIVNGIINCLFMDESVSFAQKHVKFVLSRDSEGWEYYKEFNIDD